MLTVQYPPAEVTVKIPPIELPPINFPSGFEQARGFKINSDGFIECEVSLPWDKAKFYRGVILVYLPPSMRAPQWNGQRWVETYGWHRELWAWIKARFA